MVKRKGFCPLASGSKGNALYVSDGETALLIDAGLSGRAIEQRLALLEVGLDDIDAILISHEHIDHIQGLKVLGIKKQMRVVANAATARAICYALDGVPPFYIFTTGERFQIGSIVIDPFSIQHDSADPVAFAVYVAGYKVGICTDLGFATPLVEKALQDCDYLYLEANHEPSMVHACSRPMVYKQRVLGRTGHLSNQQSAELLQKIYSNKLKQVYLAHLSAECNHPQRAIETVSQPLVAAGSSAALLVAAQESNSSPLWWP